MKTSADTSIISIHRPFEMHRFTLLLAPPRSFELKGFRGFASYSIVMDVLESEDPDLVRVRRAGKLQTDFAVRPISWDGEGRYLTLDVTSFTQEVTLALTSSILRGEMIARMGKFEVVRVEAEEVDPEQIMSTSRPVRKFSIRFHTPTFFRPRKGVRGGVFIPVPLPDRILISLHRIWNHFLGPMEDEIEREEFHRWLESWGVVISALKIETKKVVDGDKFEVGFVGWANYSANQAMYDASFLRKVDALLRMGEVTNVGGMRSKGFGVISYRRRQVEDFVRAGSGDRCKPLIVGE